MRVLGIDPGTAITGYGVVEEMQGNVRSLAFGVIRTPAGHSLPIRLEVAEYTPLAIKQAVTGYGKAGKAQMQEMVRLLLGLGEVPRPDDAADALAVAICHLHSARLTALSED
jgi:crossover junction endodeoxyribonuclease RuvC